MLSNLPRAFTTPSTHVNHEPIVQYTVLRLSNLSLIGSFLVSTKSSNDEKVFVLFCFDYVPCGASACIIEQHANTSSSVKLSLYSLTCSPSFCHHCLVSTSCGKKIGKIVKKKIPTMDQLNFCLSITVVYERCESLLVYHFQTHSSLILFEKLQHFIQSHSIQNDS